MDIEEKECEVVFKKDDRNRNGGYQAKKRTNVKEVRRRFQQMEKKRNAQMQSDNSDEQNIPCYEKPERNRKYDNGKPVRQPKPQQFYVEEQDESNDKKNKKKGGKKNNKK